MLRRTLPLLGAGAGAGVLVAFSLPPWGFWPLGIIGFGVLAAVLAERPVDQRALIAAGMGTGMFGIGLFWITEFQAFGFVALLILETAFVVGAAAATPPGRARLFVLPAALVLGEAARGEWPFGGLPLGGAALGQAGGPLAPAVRIGGPLLLLGLTAAAGAALAEVVRIARADRADRHRRRLITPGVAIAAALVVVLPLVGATLTTRAGTAMRVAAVQGGGIRGLTAVDEESDPVEVYQRHVEATGEVTPPVDLVLWPEDVVDLDVPLAGTAEEQEIAGLARHLDTTLVAGIVEGVGENHFRNAAVAWGPDGQIVDRYEKVHRVPFGEYVPLRGFIRHLANLDLIPRDAIAGHGSGRITTPAGKLGVVISYEVFFPDRARSAIRAGGSVLLVPTNASSFRTSQVPTQEVAAARLRAMETGRDTVQAAPTGFTAVVDANGHVIKHSQLGRQQVIEHVVHRRHGRTPYLRWGDGPVILAAFALVAVGWLSHRRNSAA